MRFPLFIIVTIGVRLARSLRSGDLGLVACEAASRVTRRGVVHRFPHCIQTMSMNPAAQGLVEHCETIDIIGDVKLWLRDLEEAWIRRVAALTYLRFSPARSGASSPRKLFLRGNASSSSLRKGELGRDMLEMIIQMLETGQT